MKVVAVLFIVAGTFLELLRSNALVATFVTRTVQSSNAQHRSRR